MRKNAIKRLRSNKGDKWRQKKRRSGELAIKLIDPALLFFLRAQKKKKAKKSADARRIREKENTPVRQKVNAHAVPTKTKGEFIRVVPKVERAGQRKRVAAKKKKPISPRPIQRLTLNRKTVGRTKKALTRASKTVGRKVKGGLSQEDLGRGQGDESITAISQAGGTAAGVLAGAINLIKTIIKTAIFAAGLVIKVVKFIVTTPIALASLVIVGVLGVIIGAIIGSIEFLNPLNDIGYFEPYFHTAITYLNEDLDTDIIDHNPDLNQLIKVLVNGEETLIPAHFPLVMRDYTNYIAEERYNAKMRGEDPFEIGTAFLSSAEAEKLREYNDKYYRLEVEQLEGRTENNIIHIASEVEAEFIKKMTRLMQEEDEDKTYWEYSLSQVESLQIDTTRYNLRFWTLPIPGEVQPEINSGSYILNNHYGHILAVASGVVKVTDNKITLTISDDRYVTYLLDENAEISVTDGARVAVGDIIASASGCKVRVVADIPAINTLEGVDVVTSSRFPYTHVSVNLKQYISYINTIRTGKRQDFVSAALSQEGTVGGGKYNSWYGVPANTYWCAVFVSWAGNQAGLIQDGKIPKFASCRRGVQWFQDRNRFKGRNYMPDPGDVIFFTWAGLGSGVVDHVGIVVSADENYIYTMEGNTLNNRCAQRKRPWSTVYGFGIYDD